MKRIFGFDIGTTSIGFAVIDHDPERQAGKILRLGVRVFPEARDPDGTPLNQQRRQKRMMRRQLRRRRMRRRLLNETLAAAGLLPAFNANGWAPVMSRDPYELRKRGCDKTEVLSPHEFGRALYHLAKNRHFKGRDAQEAESADEESTDNNADDPDEKAARSNRESTLKALDASKLTLGAWLAEHDADAQKRKPPTQRRRGFHAIRARVETEFEELWKTQAAHIDALRDPALKTAVRDAIFSQRPVFWRKNTLGSCRFMPGEPPCPKGFWISQQRRMLEKLNNLAFAGGNMRPLDAEERAAILRELQTKASMTWGGVRAALKPLYARRGEKGAEKRLRFNLEQGGERVLLGNAVEAKLFKVFGDAWANHPHKQALRDAVPARLRSADYGEIGGRVVILSEAERQQRRAGMAKELIATLAVAPAQAAELSRLTFSAGWEPYSITALQVLLPHLENGVRFGALVNGPEWEDWRDETFPDAERPTGEVLAKLPSPAIKEERERIANLRNPTVVRVQNELRKVVNNLIGLYGKPDLIRVELARDVGKSKREREEIQSTIRKNEKKRREATKDLISNNIADPSRNDIEKWLLWKESKKQCPYSGDHICFDALFREGRYEVEHIWPRSMSFDDSFANKTLCRRDLNIGKGNRTPYQYLGHDLTTWDEIKHRIDKMAAPKRGQDGMSAFKVRRFLAETIPEGFTQRQLNDTGYVARQTLAFLKRLWPDVGAEAPVTVQAVTGRITAQLRKVWHLNNILADDGGKTRADHRHHAIDALTVACVDPGIANRLSRYWQAKDDPRATRPELPAPWPTFRADAQAAVERIVVSHRVRKKVSGPLHKETTYGDTKRDETTASGTYRVFVTRKPVEELSKTKLDDIRDPEIRRRVREWVEANGGDPKKAFPPYPRLGDRGPEIRKVRVQSKQQMHLMVPVTTGYADAGLNHHIAIYRRSDGGADFEVVSLCEAARRLSRREPVVRRRRNDGANFVMSLSPGDAIEFRLGDERGLWVVQGISSAGRPTLSRLNDARPTTNTEAARQGVDGKRKDFEPRFGGFMRRLPRKISIDPIGRIRSAND